MKHILVTGNPVDGFEFYGPFNNGVDAVEYANQCAGIEGEWWTADLNPVEPE